MYEKIKRWYEQRLWTAAMVQNAVSRGVLTQEQAEEITAGKNKTA